MTSGVRGYGALTSTFDEALAFAACVHREQRRKGSDVPYLSHLLSVSALVLEDGGTETEAIAALLHDAVEDGPVGIRAQILTRFGREVLDIVLACSDDEPGEAGAKGPWLQRKKQYVAHLQHASVSALRVTGADKLHNARCLADDLRVEERWPPSNACVHQNLWYYASVSDALRRRLPGSRLTAALERTVRELCTLAKQPVPVASSTAPRCGQCSTAAA